ncbi:MAG: class I SAM-dependent methyltransferase [Sedimentisphaerales bacterium]|jgi:SAM-dependent methyltransferase
MYMKYYEMHEQEYQRRLAAGQTAWEKGDYEQFGILKLIERFLGESNLEPSQSSVLDIGCGTGGLACYLASRGFKVTAIDISSTAILEAKKQAASRGLKINFQATDLCCEQLPPNAFDIITDNHFLHCIVFSDERQAVLQNISRALKPHGEYWIETMVGHPAMKPRDEWHLDADGISWAAISKNLKVEGCVERDGLVLCPIRRIQPSEAILIEELQRVGFEVVWHETAPPMNENDTGTFRAKCHLKKIIPDNVL